MSARKDLLPPVEISRVMLMKRAKMRTKAIGLITDTLARGTEKHPKFIAMLEGIRNTILNGSYGLSHRQIHVLQQHCYFKCEKCDRPSAVVFSLDGYCEFHAGEATYRRQRLVRRFYEPAARMRDENQKVSSDLWFRRRDEDLKRRKRK